MKDREKETLRDLYRWKREIDNRIREILLGWRAKEKLNFYVTYHEKIQVIKMFRDFSGFTLMESKEIIDSIWPDERAILELFGKYFKD